MSISSSMNAGVAGLAAQSSNLATISDNIANASTAGYKRATTDFAAMVINGGSGAYTAGGVRSQSLRLVDARGPLTTTTNATDLAIAGRGMLPVTRSTNVLAGDGDLPFLMTSTGSFTPDANGYLRTPSGLVLLGIPVGDDQMPPNFPRTTSDALVPVRISTSEIVGSPTTSMKVTANLPAASTEAGPTVKPEVLTMTYYDNLGKSQTLDFAFTPVVPAPATPTPPASNQWSLTITDRASGTATGPYAMTFSDATGTGGRLEGVLPAAAPGVDGYDAATGTITADTPSGPIEIEIGRLGEPGGMTQLASAFAPIAMTKDGAAAGTMTGVTVDPSGFVIARYDSGTTRRLFQIPVVDVPNPNGLTALSNQTYEPTRDSGSFFLWDAGQGPTGAIQGFAREESSVDVAQELTQLIRTQRAYSTNAKVIQTVDEMLQETTNIKR